MGRALLLVVFVVLFAACTPATSAPASGPANAYRSGSDVVAALATHGVECVGRQDREPPTNVKQQLGCQVDGQDVIIRVFDDAAARDRYVQAGAAIVSQLDIDVGDAAPARVVGPTWIVTTDTRELATRIQAALGGELAR